MSATPESSASAPRPASRGHRGFYAFIGHRLSGVALAIFLPLHFLVLGTALEGATTFDSFLAFTDNPLVKAAEWGLVMFLSLHLLLGLRLLLLELGTWKGLRHGWIHWSAGLAVALGLAFLAVVSS